MPEFLKLLPPRQALQNWFDNFSEFEPSFEVIPTTEAIGRILFEDITAPHPLPEFSRSTVDGYAVIAGIRLAPVKGCRHT